MRIIEQIYRELLYQAIEKKRHTFTQLELSKNLRISISVVNYALRPLRAMGAIAVLARGFKVTDIEKILYYWANIRNLQRDIIYSTRVELPVSEIEKLLPSNTVFAAYSAYKFAFKDVPADYSEVYVYSRDISEIKKRFPASRNPPNLFVLNADKNIQKYGSVTTIGQTFADLWNIKEWYAKDFLKALEAKIHGH
ncbi:Uncharacterised protein [uncultured archaeon]|nr:Uncharacterised protein [uncultured archaeon]